MGAVARPHIGLAVGRELVGGRRYDAAPHEYVTAVLAAGGLPRLVPVLPPDTAAEALAGLDGLVLTGGGDVDPARYDATPVPEIEGVDGERDTSELALVDAVLARHLPVLAICRGAQLLNVALGGTLHQHLASRPIAHQDRPRRHQVVHRVALAGGSQLARLAGTTDIGVNSIHHQGIDRVGRGLTATGWAPDGVVESLEAPGRAVLAVQWHPECLPGEAVDRSLFAWLVSAARGAPPPAEAPPGPGAVEPATPAVQ